MPRLGRVLIALIGALMLAVLAGGAHAELKPINPLAAEGAAPPSAFAAPSATQQSPGTFGGIFGWVLRTQQSLQHDLATGVKNLKGEHVMAAAGMLVLASFIYGVVHAVGPGHGKMVISSYVVANEQTVRRGVVISFIAAALQALTAIALVGILAFALNASGLQINAWSNQLEIMSYALIALVGAWLLTTQLVRLYRRWQVQRTSAAHAGHGHHHHDHVTTTTTIIMIMPKARVAVTWSMRASLPDRSIGGRSWRWSSPSASGRARGRSSCSSSR